MFSLLHYYNDRMRALEEPIINHMVFRVRFVFFLKVASNLNSCSPIFVIEKPQKFKQKYRYRVGRFFSNSFNVHFNLMQILHSYNWDESLLNYQKKALRTLWTTPDVSGVVLIANSKVQTSDTSYQRWNLSLPEAVQCSFSYDQQANRWVGNQR